MKIETTNGEVYILDVIPYSLVKKYTREITRIAVAMGLDGKNSAQIEKELSSGSDEQKAKTVEFGFALEDAKEELVKKCIVSSSFGDTETAIEEYLITPADLNTISVAIMKRIEEQNAKKKDTQNTSEVSTAGTSE